MAAKKDNIIKNALILFLITVIAGTLLGLTYEVTKEPIRLVQERIKNDALKSVVKDADTFEELAMTGTQPETILSVYAGKKDGDIVGYAFEMVGKEAYGGDINLMVGLSGDGSILGIDIVKHSETPGLGAKADEDEFKSEFVGEPVQPLTVVKVSPSPNEGEISSISGATITSRSVAGAVNVATDYYRTNLEVK